MVLGGYLLIIILKYTWKPFKNVTWLRFGFLFLSGFLVHFAMEITLLSAGIRPVTEAWTVLLFNSLLEFNTGVPILFFAWNLITYLKHEKGLEENIPE